jgi:hypothetical protein
MKLGEVENKKQSLDEVIDSFHDFLILCKEMLELEKLPPIKWVTGGEFHRKHQSFGSFTNQTDEIHVEITNRHPLDIMRTLAHELVHYRQNLDGKIGPNSGDDGSPQENEAHAVAGLIMRKFDHAHPEAFNMRPIEESKQPKKNKISVKYQDHPKKNNYCKLCTMFKSPNQCTAVIGNVNPMGWCNIYELSKTAQNKLKKTLETAVTNLENKLLSGNRRDYTYQEIDKIMKKISIQSDITADQLHDAFKKKHGVIPDEWIENQEVG